MTEPVHRALAMARRPLARPEHRLERSIPEHRRILAAVAAADADEARAAMRAHLDTVEGYLREYAQDLVRRRDRSDLEAPKRAAR
jgi:GntR family transcriptional repressor for pyruvate dehydrogenase complex